MWWSWSPRLPASFSLHGKGPTRWRRKWDQLPTGWGSRAEGRKTSCTILTCWSVGWGPGPNWPPWPHPTPGWWTWTPCSRMPRKRTCTTWSVNSPTSSPRSLGGLRSYNMTSAPHQELSSGSGPIVSLRLGDTPSRKRYKRCWGWEW